MHAEDRAQLLLSGFMLGSVAHSLNAFTKEVEKPGHEQN